MTNAADRVPPFRGTWRLIWRLPLFGLHALFGLPLTLCCFLPVVRGLPAGGMPLRLRAHMTWQRWTLRLFGVRLRVTGRLPEGPCLVVANHISWLDIVMLQSLWPMWLVAKSEIRRWPLIGWLAELGGTLFIERGRLDSRRRVGRRMAALLRRGHTIGVFPEGGIRPEPGVGRFHAPLFAPAVRTRAAVVPVAIRYQRDGIDLHEDVVFSSGESFPRNLLRLLAQRPLDGRLSIGTALHDCARGRRALAEQSAATVRRLYAEG